MYGKSVILIVAVIVAILWIPVSYRVEHAGVNRKFQPMLRGKAASVQLGGCEDLDFHAASGVIYGACAHKTFQHRTKWFPPTGKFASEDGAHFKESDGLFIIDPKTDKVTQLTLKDFKSDKNPRGIFKAHGLSTFSRPDEPNTVYIHAVNHYASKEDGFTYHPRIEIFKHQTGDSHVDHIETVEHPLIRTPNDVLALSEKSFYVTNDHKHLGQGFFSHMMRFVEDLSFIGMSDVILREDSGRVRVIVRDLPTPNGICRGPGNVIIINSAVAGIMHVFEQRMDLALSKKAAQQLPSAIDNPSYDNSTNTYYQIGHIDILKFLEAAGNVQKKSPVAVYRVTDNQGESQFFGERFIVKKIYEGEGKLVNAATVAVRVPSLKKLYVSGLYGPTIAVLSE
ncbi:serum paraoxonase/arylesterase [Planoprotostelium fungivorum]|uniref:Serum paraoxonase/arylesterase n=1 Tax=Planoprotostelium fungivorum TaxID=1890364 RepID=A0A2P6NTJ1_9EUKA|nr:serum paraoxonase/arylesterase [Planoprotostelium fungivorum]